MPTSRPFAYNTGSTISGTEQVGNLAIGVPTSGFESTGIQWWNGPDEDLGYVIAYPQSGGTQPTPYGGFAYVQFWRTKVFTDQEFLNLCNSVIKTQNFTDVSTAKTYLNNNGYWTSFVNVTPTPSITPTITQTPSITPTVTTSITPTITTSITPSITPTVTPTTPLVQSGLILEWDVQNLSSYPGSGTTITDLESHSNGTITGTVTYTSGSPKYLTIEGSSTEYVQSISGLNSYLSPVNTGTAISVFMWVYPTSNGVILSEQGSLPPPDSGWYDSQIELIGGTMKFRVWPLGSPYLSSTIATPLNAWYYLGFTYSGTTLTAYVNGQNAGSTTLTRQSPGNNGFNLYYNLGYPTFTNMGSGVGSTFRFGALQVYNRGLISSEVLSNYNSTKSIYGL